MSSNNETSTTNTIEEKKMLNLNITNKPIASQVLKFLQSVIYIIIHIAIYFSCSGLILYVCKLAQTNILPTEIECLPYKSNDVKINEVKTNIFVTGDPPQSMKVEFPYNEYNKSNKFLDFTRIYKEKPKSNFLANYFISVIESIIHLNYSAINTIMNFINEIPEILIVLFGPIFIGFLLFFLFLFNQLYIIYSWFSNLGWFFKTNKNDTNEGKPQWEDVSFSSPIQFGLALLLSFIFIILFFIGYPILSFITFICLNWCIFSSLFYKGLLNGKNINAFDIIIFVFKYYKITISSIISLLIISAAFSKLGSIQGIFAILTILLVYFGFLKFELFKPITEENLTPLVSYNQAKKICSSKLGITSKNKGIISNLLGMNGGAGGINLTKQLKKLYNYREII